MALARKVAEARERRHLRNRLKRMIEICEELQNDYNEMEDQNMHRLMRIERQRLEGIRDLMRNGNGDRDGD